MTGNSSKAILGATLTIGKQYYKSNWLVANFQYGVLLRIPWYIAYNLSINCKRRIVKIGGNELAIDSIIEIKAQILNLSVRNF